MAKYDDASWHYEGEYPEDLPTTNAATHIGMFLAWCFEMGFASEELIENESENIDLVISHKMTGAKILITELDEKFSDNDLNDLGNSFAQSYYEDDTKFTKKYSSYIDDYCDILGTNDEQTLYHVNDTWENYELLKPILDTRFEEWKKFANYK